MPKKEISYTFSCIDSTSVVKNAMKIRDRNGWLKRALKNGIRDDKQINSVVALVGSSLNGANLLA